METTAKPTVWVIAPRPSRLTDSRQAPPSSILNQAKRSFETASRFFLLADFFSDFSEYLAEHDREVNLAASFAIRLPVQETDGRFLGIYAKELLSF